MFEITHLCTLLLTLSIIRELSQGWVTFYILSCYMLICRSSDMYLKLLHPFLLIFIALGWANNVLFHHISHLKNTSEVYQPLSTWSKVETCRHEGWFIGGPMLKICYQGYPPNLWQSMIHFILRLINIHHLYTISVTILNSFLDITRYRTCLEGSFGLFFLQYLQTVCTNERQC